MATINTNADSLTLTLNGYVFTSFISGDIIELTPVNDYSSQIISTNGGLNAQKRVDGDQHDLTIRIAKRSDDDIFMNSQINRDDLVVFNGSIKENYTRDDGDGVDTFLLENGTLMTLPTFISNDMDGNALMEYVIRFRSVRRNL